MDPSRTVDDPNEHGLPRTRGDGPARRIHSAGYSPASPHTRGWTRGSYEVRVLNKGFPAHAGMDPGTSVVGHRSRGLPRTRGDGPETRSQSKATTAASPHTRGWTHGIIDGGDQVSGFPAHAGMDRRRVGHREGNPGLPRTRGDGPRATGSYPGTSRASPHTRGWTPLGQRGREVPPGFPAHAGMDLGSPRRAAGCLGLPRTRGDGPEWS